MRSYLRLALISVIFLIISMDTVADSPTQFGEIVYLQVTEDDTRQIVYRSGEVVHYYSLEQGECYYIYTGLNGELLNNFLITAQVENNLKIINMALNSTILELAWDDNWYLVDEPQTRCSITWYRDYISIRSRNENQSYLLDLSGQSVGTFNYETRTNRYCGLSYINCNQLEEIISSMLPRFSEPETIGYKSSRNSRYMVLSACVVGNRFQDEQSCRRSDLHTIVLNLDTQEIEMTLPDAIPMYYDYSAIGNSEILTNANLYEFSHSGRFLSYLSTSSIVIYDLLLEEVTHQIPLGLTDEQVIPFWARLNWSPDDERIIFDIGLLAVAYPTNSVGLFDVRTGELQIVDLEHDISYQFVWTLNGDAFIWLIPTGSGVNGGIVGTLMAYNIMEKQQEIIDINVGWHVGR